MLYVLAFPKFTTKVTRSIDLFRARHEPERARLVGAHITLAFGLSGVDAHEFSQSCRKAVAGTRTVHVEFHRFDIDYDPFEKSHKIFMLCSTGSDALGALHRALYRGAHRDHLESDVYRPHMTIATNAEREVLERSRPTSIGTFPIHAVVDAVDVVRIAGGALEKLATIPLAA